jgi:hypothetical protein
MRCFVDRAIHPCHVAWRWYADTIWLAKRLYPPSETSIRAVEEMYANGICLEEMTAA